MTRQLFLLRGWGLRNPLGVEWKAFWRIFFSMVRYWGSVRLLLVRTRARIARVRANNCRNHNGNYSNGGGVAVHQMYESVRKVKASKQCYNRANHVHLLIWISDLTNRGTTRIHFFIQSFARNIPVQVGVPHQSILLVFCAIVTGILPPSYPNPSSQGHSSLLLCSNVSIEVPLCIVSAISSNPFSRQCLRKGSVMKGIAALPFGRLTSCFSRSTSSSSPAPASSANARQFSSDRETGSMPFCIELLLKISAKLGAMTHRIPKSFLY